MASWSQRRRFLYATVAIVVLVAAVGVPLFLLIYQKPTCSDGVKNGLELDVDCGGACARLCPSAFLPPVVSWVRFKEVSPRLHNVAAYIINPNQGVEAAAVPYKITLYDREALPIAEYVGTVTLPARRNVLAFQASVDAGAQTPIRGTFEFLAVPTWERDSRTLDGLHVTDQVYTENPGDSSLLVTLLNQRVEPVDRVTVFAILKDGVGNVLDFSKTVIDAVPAEGSATAPFTWPISHDKQVISIEVLLVAE